MVSLFTTESASSCWRRSGTRFFHDAAGPANFNIGPDGSHAIYPFSSIASITFNRQVTTGPTFSPFVGPNLLPLRFVPGAVGRVAFGRFEAVDYMAHPGEYIPEVATRTGAPAAQGTQSLYFNVILPSGLTPAAGWPVAIVGHGRGQHKNFAVDSGTRSYPPAAWRRSRSTPSGMASGRPAP